MISCISCTSLAVVFSGSLSSALALLTTHFTSLSLCAPSYLLLCSESNYLSLCSHSCDPIAIFSSVWVFSEFFFLTGFSPLERFLSYLSIVWSVLLINLCSFGMYHEVFIPHSDLKGVFPGNRTLTWNSPVFEDVTPLLGSVCPPHPRCSKFSLFKVFLNHICEPYSYHVPGKSFILLKDHRDSCRCGF